MTEQEYNESRSSLDLIFSTRQISVGDKVDFFDKTVGAPVTGKIIHILDDYKATVEVPQTYLAYYVSLHFISTNVYRPSDANSQNSQGGFTGCCCGATKVYGQGCNSRFHADYCSLGDKEAK